MNHLPGIVGFLGASGHTLESEGRFEGAKALYWEAKRLSEELGDDAGVINSLQGLAGASLGLGEVDEAAAHAWEAYGRAEEAGLTLLVTDTLMSLGRVATAEGNLEGARELLLRSMKMAVAQGRGGGRRSPGALALVYWAELLAAEGEPEEAVSLLAVIEGPWDSKDRILDKLEGSLRAEEFAEAHERGRGRTVAEVVRELLPGLR